MRRNRLKIASGGYYHVINRVHGHEFLFQAETSAKFVEILRKVEVFCGVRVLTYCVMSNHFHLLVHVPERVEVDDKELLRRYEQLSPGLSCRQFMERWERCVERNDEAGLMTLRARLRARMYDLSMFMKELKQRYTQWYNWKYDRQGKGTFWTDRFKSVLVEGGWKALATVAAYIDLNPVRAGMVTDPKDHPWCGYSEAYFGGHAGLAGLRALWEATGNFMGCCDGGDREILRSYSVLLFGKAIHRKGSVRVASDINELFRVHGMLAPWEMACGRRPWMTAGGVIGSRAFLSDPAYDRVAPGSGCARRKIIDIPENPGWATFCVGRGNQRES